MYNHARTLLANQPSFNGVEYVAEEATPKDFVPVKTIPGYLTVVRSVLFGSKPDRHMINYRCRQLMRLVHSTPLIDYVLQMDPRVTYSLDSPELVPVDAFLPRVLQVSGATATLFIEGRPSAPDSTGQMSSVTEVRIVAPDSVSILAITPSPKNQFLPFALTSGLSDAVPLSRSGYSCRLTTTVPQTAWNVSILNRPQADLSSLVSNLEVIGEPNLTALFGVTNEEPFLTFRNLWTQQRELPLRLSALLMAAIYRTDQLWKEERGTE